MKILHHQTIKIKLVAVSNVNERNAPASQTTTEKSIEEMHEKSKETSTEKIETAGN
jgi:hypothetical protein